MKYYRAHILISMDENSLQAGAKEIEKGFIQELKKKNLQEEVSVLPTGTLGYFRQEVCILILPDNIVYRNVSQEDVTEIVSEHLLKGRPVKRLIYGENQAEKVKLSKQKRIVLEHSGLINPESIEEYIAYEGYEACLNTLLKKKPEEVVEEVKKSGLRGRGGAGFPTGLKWSFTQPIKAAQKFLLINADEGEPGTFKDRLIMEGDPHKILEGMIIAGYAIGATTGYIYIRGEYKLCIKRMQKAIEQAYEFGFLGKNIAETGFDFDIEIKIGAGAYVCGEETAMIESLEGKRGNPRVKPPFPGVAGIWNKPTVVNNVETIANIPSVMLKGADWYRTIGTPESCGTKVYTIMGDVQNPGLCEVEMGTPLRVIIDDYAGGMLQGKRFKTALVGGAAGAFIPYHLLDVKMDFHNLAGYKAVLGSGAILVMSEEKCIAEMLWSILKFFRHESCGKCSPCSKGTEILYRLITKVIRGKGSENDLKQLLSVSEGMKISLCALGQSPVMPIKSALQYFPEDFKGYLTTT
jgi:NADH:ubiquinone oxidoreductase subunit F (NADH-binding)/(2Fe-2S) ferredoxin